MERKIEKQKRGGGAKIEKEGERETEREINPRRKGKTKREWERIQRHLLLFFMLH